MNPKERLDPIRRILLLAASREEAPENLTQLELPLWPADAARSTSAGADLSEVSERAHELILELLLLIQIELSGLVASPLHGSRRRRIGLGGDPPLRVLGEWERARPSDAEPWKQGVAARGREEAYSEGLGRVRWLTGALGLPPARVREIVRRLYSLTSRSSPEEDLPGLVLGHASRHRLVPSQAGRLAFRVDRDLGRMRGAVHTPEDLAAELVRTLMTAGPPDSEPEILDPACGSGQFLLAAARFVAGADAAAGSERLSRLRRLHGVDLDPWASRITAFNLSLWAAREAARSLQPETGDIGLFLDQLFGRSFPYFLGRQIQVGNSLHLQPTTYSPGFIWERRFPWVFERPQPGFDVVVGNPPWVSYGLRDRGGVSPEERMYYQRLYPAGTQYKLSLYSVFMELALRLCRPGGVHGFLVPDSVLSGHHFSRIRRLLLSSADLLELSLIGSGVWRDIEAGNILLYAVRRKGGSAPAPVSVRNRVLLPGKLGQPAAEVAVPSTHYAATGQAPLRIYRDPEEMTFLSRVTASPFRIRDVAWSYSGLIARYGQKSVQGPTPRAEFRLLDGGGAVAFLDEGATLRWRPALWSGGEIAPYRIQWRGGHVYWPPDRADLARIYKSGFDAARYEGMKVFLRQTGDRLVAAVDPDGFLGFNNLHVLGCIPAVGIPPLLLAGVLMSGPLQRTYRILTLESGRPLAQVDLKMVESLPFPANGDGRPIGAAPLPSRSWPQARRILRAVERAAETRERHPLLDIAAAAWRAGPAPFEGGPLLGSEVLTLTLVRLLELREAEAQAAGFLSPLEWGRRRKSAGDVHGRSVLQEMVDEVMAILFQISPVSETASSRGGSPAPEVARSPADEPA